MAEAALFEREAPNYAATTFPPPRPFQLAAHEKLRQGIRDGHRAQMLMAPTGAGKTYLGMRVVQEGLVKGSTATFMCDRTTLINQTSDVAESYGLKDHGIIQADHWRYLPSMPFQIASAQTVARRKWPDSRIVVIDEAHTQLKVWTDYVASWKDIPVREGGPVFIGLSATPFARGLGKLFTNLVNAATMHELTESGVLVPMKVMSCTPINMKGAATVGGEWSDAAAGERGLEVVGDVVLEWQKWAEGRKTICFGATIAHCEALAKQFNEAGVMAGVFCSTTNDAERKALLHEFRKVDGELRVLVSVEALAKGFDVKDVRCVIDCRPLRKSLSTAIQMWGRGLRSSPETGKTDCLLLDHSGNIVRFADDYSDVFYNGLDTLDDGEKLDAKVRKDEDGEDKGQECPECHYRPFARKCIACGFEVQSSREVEHGAGVMRPVMIGKTQVASNQRELWAQLSSYVRQYGKPETRQGRAYHLFKHITGQELPGFWRVNAAAELVPIPEPVLRKITQHNMAYAKSRMQR